jgi:hypothetical protein
MQIRGCTRSLYVIQALLFFNAAVLFAQSPNGVIAGIVRDQAKTPLPGALLTAVRSEDKETKSAVSGADGSYTIADARPGTYSVMAAKEGYSQAALAELQVMPDQVVAADFTVVPASTKPIGNVAPGGFWKRYLKAYADDCHRSSEIVVF